MLLPLRLTYKNSDVIFYILNEKLSVATKDINVSVDGETCRLHKQLGKWQPDETCFSDKGLLSAIGNSIALRYRI